MPDPITRIVFRRGLEAERTSLTLLQGEPGYATDSKRLYVGDGVSAGNPAGIFNLGIATFGAVASNLTGSQVGRAPAIGDIVFDTTSSFIYALTASDSTLVSSFAKYGATVLPDEVTITDNAGTLGVKTGSLDATYFQGMAIGRGLERIAGDQTLRIVDPGPELTFSGSTLYISPAGVTNEKLAVMQPSTVKARLGSAGLPQDVPFTDFAAAIKQPLTDILQIAGIPAGTILDFAGGTAPAGYLSCDGSAVSRTTYSTLFAIIGTTWGVGNGGTTFNLPDLRRRVTVGSGGTGTSTLGSNLANVGGAEAHTLTVDEIPAHTHIVPRDNSTPGSIDSYGATESGGNSANTRPFGTLATGGSQPHDNIQPSAIVNKIIKT